MWWLSFSKMDGEATGVEELDVQRGAGLLGPLAVFRRGREGTVRAEAGSRD